jgi:hypothetical protein
MLMGTLGCAGVAAALIFALAIVAVPAGTSVPSAKV